MRPSDYILRLEKYDLVGKFDKIGFTTYAIGDGTYYAIAEDAPQESHDLAISAIEGYPDAIDEIRGFKLSEITNKRTKSYDGNESLIASAANIK